MNAPTKAKQEHQAAATGNEQQRSMGISAEAAENRAHRLVGEMQAMVVFFGEEIRRLVSENMALKQELAKCKTASAPDVPFGTTAQAETSAQQ